MKDKWRYVYLPDYMIDGLISTSPEDDIIRRLDGEEEGSEPSFSAYDILKILQRKEAEIVESILYDGETFEATGISMGLSKQRVHQIYKATIEKLKGVI
jgi:DNA-directed RNA polymerase sigma subunit (sigma70/sigma32)